MKIPKTQPVKAASQPEQQTNPAPERKNGLFLRFDPYEKARRPFIFVDMSKGASPKARRVYVRRPNGDLMTATAEERLWAARKVS